MLRATCYLYPHGAPCPADTGAANRDGVVRGEVHFEELANGDTRVSYRIEGLTPGDHGFHIHESADFSRGCASAGPHYNPYQKTHGSRSNSGSSGSGGGAVALCPERHAGDLGNVRAGADGIACGRFTDSLVKLRGLFSVVGRSVVVHADPDDEGRGGHELSATTGNAGARVACGEIALAQSMGRL